MKKVLVYIMVVLIALFIWYADKSHKKEDLLTVKTVKSIGDTDDMKNMEVNVFSSRKENLIKPIFDAFTKSTNIKVNYLTDSSPQKLIARMQEEVKSGRVDLFITADVINLLMAEEKGLLQEIHSENIEKAIPSKFRSDKWFGLTKRARIIVFNKNSKYIDLVQDYEDLVKPDLKGKVVISSSNVPYNQSLLASMIIAHGYDGALQWAKSLVANLAYHPKGGETQQIKDVANGIADFTIVNSYYYVRFMNSDNKIDKELAKNLLFLYPNQKNRGSMVNVSGAGIVKNARNKENGIKLLEFMVTKDAQKIFMDLNKEYPITDDIEFSLIMKSMGAFKEDSIPLEELKSQTTNATIIADKAGWR